MMQQDAAWDWKLFGDFYKGFDGPRNHDSLRFKTDGSYKDLVDLLTVSTCFDLVKKVVCRKNAEISGWKGVHHEAPLEACDPEQ